MSANVWHALVDLVYPPRCLVCQQPTRERRHFCESCHQGLFVDPHPCCPRCAATVGPFAVWDGKCSLCRSAPLGFDAALRSSVYDGALQRAILRMKNARYEGLAEHLGQCWAELQRPRFEALEPDALVPVPLHWWRRLRRGYNQSCAIAWGLSTVLRVPYRPWWLWRSRWTPSQKNLSSEEERRANVRGAFRARKAVKGLRVLLDDDVMTTGATVDEAALALKGAGALWVGVAVLARAGG